MEAKHKENVINFLIKYRYVLGVLSIVLTVLLALPAKNLYFESDYKIYFEKNDANLLAHEEMQDVYTKTDNLAIIIQPADKNVFTNENLAIVREITELSWQAPYVIRVDSLSNFQHTSAQGDDLSVADLVPDVDELSAIDLEYIKSVALKEKSMVGRLVSVDGSTTLINITVELPPVADPNADFEIQAKQRLLHDSSYPEIVEFGRQIVADFEDRYPNMEMHLTGVSVVTNSFNESTIKDMSSLVPMMYVVIMVMLAVFLRSISSIVGALLVIACASVVGVSCAAWLGYAINTVNVSSPVIILTIAVCDSVHLLVIYLRALGMKMTPREAMYESIRLNFQPIILTSVTTAVGFFTLNFSISPPFQEFGNMTAVGVLWAMVLTFTLLPAMTMLLVRTHNVRSKDNDFLQSYAVFVVKYRKLVFAFSFSSALILMSFIMNNVIDDDPITYFKPGVPYRDASDFMQDSLPGVKDLNFSIDCGAPGCVNDVQFLEKLGRFEEWLSSVPKVVYVSSYTDVIKRLNRSMNRDDETYYRIPNDSNLSAQYNLLYEMSLPYGLDLNNQLNIDKSAARVSVLMDRMTTDDLIEFELQGRQWLLDNYPEIASPGASISLMFAHMGVNNIKSMFIGGLFAIMGVTLTILIALRSFRYALISLIPNSFPAFMAFGAWGLLVGQVNMAVAGVFSVSLGILVDDTIHFITKYRDGRLTKKLSPEESIYYAFSKVGSALIVTTIVLVLGFGLLTLSDFNLNAMTGMLTAITIGIALIFDFLILPPLLIMFDRDLEKVK